jgi:hypothetical protein
VEVTVSIIDELTRQAGRIAGDVQTSIRRARVEGERRLLQRQHRAALEELGERAYALVKSGELPEAPLAAEVASVEAKLAEIERKAAEIDGDGDGAGDAPAAEEPGPATATAETSSDPSRAAFPMVDGAQEAPPDEERRSPGPGWEQAERFFRRS